MVRVRFFCRIVRSVYQIRELKKYLQLLENLKFNLIFLNLIITSYLQSSMKHLQIFTNKATDNEKATRERTTLLGSTELLEEGAAKEKDKTVRNLRRQP